LGLAVERGVAAVVLLHDSGFSLDAFDGIAARLRPTCEVIRPDLPESGRIGPRPAGWPHATRCARAEFFEPAKTA
jgi:hypothetical protein